MRTVAFLLLSIIHSPSFCQVNNSSQLPSITYDTVAIGRVLYEQQVQLSEEMAKNGSSVLLFNTTSSLYMNLEAPMESKTSIEDMVPRTVMGDKYGFPYYKSHREQKIIYRERCIGAKGKCLVEDTLGGIAWTLHPEHKRFGKYDARRATGMFRGREYEVWYTLEIPIPSGPYKLGGLPGLILEAQTTDGIVRFLFSRLEIAPGIPTPIKPPPGKPSGMNYETYLNAKWEMAVNVVKSQQAAGNEVTISPSKEIIELWEAPK